MEEKTINLNEFKTFNDGERKQRNDLFCCTRVDWDW